MPRIVLATASTYRQSLLRRLGVPFVCDAPAIDESHKAGEPAAAMARRLSLAKAYAVGPRHCNALIIASDQVGALGRSILGKPGSVEAAISQLQSMSGRSVRFLTGLCVLDMRDGRCLHAVETCTVRLRALDPVTIRHYVERERPLDCAGSFKVEGLGIALFESVRSADPTILEGLPLIRLSEFLRELGAPVLVEPDPAIHAVSR
jgi:septum formation protein